VVEVSHLHGADRLGLLVGQIIGALVFGRLSDQLGRRLLMVTLRLLMVTLLLYLPGTGAAAFNRP
jgi:MFS family permease